MKNLLATLAFTILVVGCSNVTPGPYKYAQKEPEVTNQPIVTDCANLTGKYSMRVDEGKLYNWQIIQSGCDTYEFSDNAKPEAKQHYKLDGVFRKLNDERMLASARVVPNGVELLIVQSSTDAENPVGLVATHILHKYNSVSGMLTVEKIRYDVTGDPVMTEIMMLERITD